MNNVENLNVKIFADGADKNKMVELNNLPLIKGLTTNPTLMKRAGILNYTEFCKDILTFVNEKSISFEVFSDDFEEMERQALIISSWADNVYVKIPITNTKKEKSRELIKTLVKKRVKVNVTAIMNLDQVDDVLTVLDNNLPSYISVFAGRIADTGIDPLPIMKECVSMMSSNSMAELIWASPRELLNIFHANQIGCHIITVTPDILNKIKLIGYDLEQFSLDTVKMFYQDALEAGYEL